MTEIFKTLKRYLNPIFDTKAAGFYILSFAIAIGVATFIENDFGTSAAQKVIYQAWWFELLLLLFSITIIVNMIRFRMFEQKKWSLLLFHFSIIIILIGSAVTRHFGYEGMMHIREDSTSNSFISREAYLQFEVLQNNQKFSFDEPVLFASLGNNRWKESYLVNNKLIKASVKRFIPNPQRVLVDSEDGFPAIKIVVAGMNGREEHFLSLGENKTIQDRNFNFTNEHKEGAVNIYFRNDSILISNDRPMAQMVMATQQSDTLESKKVHMLRLRSMYNDGMNSFVFGDFKTNARPSVVSSDAKVKSESLVALHMNIATGDESKDILVYGQKGVQGRPSIVHFDDLSIAVSYGAKPVFLPFSIKLYKFILEKYPGTENAASYASEVQLIDPRKGIKEDHRIYMNHILDHGGYRFFQSSFDKDEKGTYLSVNYDFWGTWISYIGYALLTIGFILTMMSKKSRFYQLSQRIKNLRSGAAMTALIVLFSLPSNLAGQKTIDHSNMQNIVDSEHAALFSTVVVQDHKGRMKPIHTLSREVLRKIARTEDLFGLTADQVVLGMLVNSADWNHVPMIKIGKHKNIHKLIGVDAEKAAYNDLFTEKGAYKLKDEVRRAYGQEPIDRGVYEKELMKLDERVNIASMVYSGRFFKIIPVPEDPDNIWVSHHRSHKQDGTNNEVAEVFFNTYLPAVFEAMLSKDYTIPNNLLGELKNYQREKGAEVIPSEARLKSEVILNELNVFGRLSLVYLLLGLAFLVALFASVFKPDIKLDLVYKILFTLVVVGFLFHTLGLGLRWYVSGRAPWSNGYESMIYIAWTTALAGLLFTRKSMGGLAATMVLSATILLVATLSYLDPEITPLVPVLRSYWLTIHVSLEAGSYGFLMLGAITGLLNLILMIFLSEKNKSRIHQIVKELSYISEMTLIGGLAMISVGTYLGGIWANESWGRYWGWDAKETWALVTILVYAFILHMRIIPKLGGLYLYNVATLFGWASVIMTYYGVNYYLSGLHSYAAGDPVPIPQWVYYSVAGVIIISILAYWRKSKFKIGQL
ncbi:MAG: cytochrome c biogenesis protein CcsA [Bacteroidia bacterium]|nr:cytochrome c biogenesis protein CcsA [Bacteroidia bacterium]